jgi:hypothetical protein
MNFRHEPKINEAFGRANGRTPLTPDIRRNRMSKADPKSITSTSAALADDHVCTHEELAAIRFEPIADFRDVKAAMEPFQSNLDDLCIAAR